MKPENVFLANGSDDILNFAMMAFNDDEDTLLFPDISYSFYEVIANLHGVNFRKVPLQEDMTIDTGITAGTIAMSSFQTLTHRRESPCH